MTSDPRFHTPGPDGPGAGTEGPEPEPEAEQPQDDLASDAEPTTSEAAPATSGGESVDVAALEAKAAKADEYLSLAQRTQADFENFRKRAAREASAATQRGATKLAKDLLPAVDNLERALEHAQQPDSEAAEAFISGIRHVHSDLIAALQRAGIERYSPEGEPFDPTLHEAVAQQPFDGFEAGTVVEVFQRGYRIGESVVRPARVVVAG